MNFTIHFDDIQQGVPTKERHINPSGGVCRFFSYFLMYHLLFSCIAEADANQNQGPTIKLQQNNGPVPDCDPLKE